MDSNKFHYMTNLPEELLPGYEASKFNTDANETIGEQTVLSFKMPLPAPLSHPERYETLYGTQTGRDDLLFTSMIDLLLFFYYLWLEAGGCLFLDDLNIYCRTGIVQISGVSFALFQNKCSR